MECWKCGSPSGENVECDRCLNTNITYTPGAAGTAIPIDWTKVNTLDDLKLVLSEYGFRVVQGSASHYRLQRFLQ